MYLDIILQQLRNENMQFVHIAKLCEGLLEKYRLLSIIQYYCPVPIICIQLCFCKCNLVIEDTSTTDVKFKHENKMY